MHAIIAADFAKNYDVAAAGAADADDDDDGASDAT